MFPSSLRSPTWLPPDISTTGPAIDRLLVILHVFLAVIFVGWGVYLIYCLVRFRAGASGHRAARARRFTFPKYLELGIFLFEAALLIFLSAPVWTRLHDRFPDPAKALIVHVIAEQFAWNIHYPGRDGVFGNLKAELIGPTNLLGLDRESPGGADDIVTTNDFHVPVRRPVIVRLSSKDVIHDFNVPVLRVKQDAIPGIGSRIWFEATGTGTFDIACAQLCGNGHFRMRGRLVVETPEAFAAWLAKKEGALHAG